MGLALNSFLTDLDERMNANAIVHNDKAGDMLEQHRLLLWDLQVAVDMLTALVQYLIR